MSFRSWRAGLERKMLIAKIVSSNSHIDYVARVVDAFDGAEVPSADDHAFGNFVSIAFDDGGSAVGIIYNSLLVNPEFASYGPRLSSKPELETFSPDYLNEQGILIGILMVGTFGPDGSAKQGVPARTVSAGAPVESLGEEAFRDFHKESGGIAVHYLPQVMAHTGSFANPLMESIIRRLEDGAGNNDLRKLTLVRENLAWQRTVGGSRL